MASIIWILFLVGAVFGTLGDFFHVASKTDGYLQPWLALPTGQPLWVPFLFGSAVLGIGVSHPLLDQLKLGRTFQSSRPSPGFSQGILGGAAFLILYAASGFLPLHTGGLKDLVLFAGCLTIWGIFDRTLKGVLLGITTSIIGTWVEIFLTRSGAFFYYPDASNLMGVPTWLPWLYVAASVAVGNIGRYLFSTLSGKSSQR